MTRPHLHILAAALFTACAGHAADAAPPASTAIDHPGCFMLQNLETGAVTTVHPEVCARARTPASTFKIPHALVALATGVVTDPHAQVPWDGTQYAIADWNAPQSLASAIQVSAVWFFQRTAAAIGRERMQAGLRDLRYGDMEVSGDITGFWLGGGSLEITGPQQLDFLARMARRDLPIATRHIDTVWDLLRVDPARMKSRLPAGETWPATAATFAAKTGTDDGVSWWVGRVDGPRGAHVFVSRVDDLPASRTSASLAAGLHALRDAGVI